METHQAIQDIVMMARAESSNSWVWTIYHDGGATKGKNGKPDKAGWGYWATLQRSREWTQPPPQDSTNGQACPDDAVKVTTAQEAPDQAPHLGGSTAKRRCASLDRCRPSHRGIS
jgi:hypothetical protein